MVEGPYPLLFEPILVEKVWGGRQLERLGRSLPPQASIGESWELADLPRADGSAAHSRVRNGALAGMTLREVASLWGSDLTGDVELESDGGFPLLVKLLDARQHLSVQVHPSPEYASSRPGVRTKSECWHVLDAAPGATLFLGLADGVGVGEVAAATNDGAWDGLLRAIPAEPGRWYPVPSGTVHALGAGVVVAEIQTASDTTYRLYDWTAEYDRPPRDMHIDDALAAMDPSLRPEPVPAGRPVRAGVFTVEQHEVEGSHSVEVAPGDAPVLMVLDGAIHVAGVEMGRGEACLIPAALGPQLTVSAEDPARIALTRLV